MTSRILFFGDLAATGFGTVTQDLGRALIAKGIDVRFVSMNDTTGLGEPFASRTVDQTSMEQQLRQISGKEVDTTAVEAMITLIPVYSQARPMTSTWCQAMRGRTGALTRWWCSRTSLARASWRHLI